MPGNNLFTQLAEFREKANNGPLSGAAATNIPDSQICHHLRRAYERIAAEWPISIIRQTSQALASGQSLYIRPALRLGTRINAITVIKTDGTRIPLTQLLPDDANTYANQGSTADDTGDPAYWWYSRKLLAAATVATKPGRLAVPGQMIEIRPVPTWALDEGLVFEFPRMPQQLFRVYQQSAITASFYQDSNVVIVNGTPALVPGDEIGRITTANFDGSTAFSSGYKSMPLDWYQIQDYYASTTGASILVNGDFASGLTGWDTSGGGISAAGIGATFAAAGSVNNYIQEATATMTVSSVYSLTFTYIAGNGTAFDVYFGTALVGSYGTSGGSKTVTVTGTATGATPKLKFIRTAAPKSGTIQIGSLSLLSSDNIQICILDRPYEGADALLSVFVTAQVADLEYSAPGGLQGAPVKFALADHFSRTDPDFSDRCEGEGRAIMDRFNPDEGEYFVPTWAGEHMAPLISRRPSVARSPTWLT